jgi:hypothetical protein
MPPKGTAKAKPKATAKKASKSKVAAAPGGGGDDDVVVVGARRGRPSSVELGDDELDVPPAPKRFAAVVQSSLPDDVNAAYYGRLLKAYQTIMQHPIFENIQLADPLPIEKSERCGHEAVFMPELYRIAIGETRLYKSSGNIFWLDAMGSSQAGVPIRLAGVRELQSHYFFKPLPFPAPVVVAVTAGEDPMTVKGQLRRMSPDEMVHALWFQIAADIDSGVEDDRLKGWVTTCLTVSFEFKLLERDTDLFWEPVRLRTAAWPARPSSASTRL